MNQYLPELYSRSGWNVEVQINLSNYGTKVNIVDNKVVKRTVYDKFVIKVNSVYTK